MSDVDPIVSYILTTKDRAPFLRTALESLTGLVTDQDELIVVDGGSSDDTMSVIADYRNLITTSISEPDRGEAHGFNKAMLLARGEFIKLVTDDDVIFPDAMREAVRALQQHPDVDAILCGGEQYRVNANTGAGALVGYQWLPSDVTLESDPMQLFRTIQCGVGLLFRRRIIPLIGLLDTSFRTVDSDFMFRLLARGVNFKYLNIKLYRHNDLPHSGMYVVEECQRDRLRILARSGRWDELMNEHTYGRDLIGAVLGVTCLTHGRSAMIAILEIERLRRSRVGWLVVPLAHTMRIIGAVGRRVMAPFRLSRRVHQFRTTEPDWDGSLR